MRALEDQARSGGGRSAGTPAPQMMYGPVGGASSAPLRDPVPGFGLAFRGGSPRKGGNSPEDAARRVAGVHPRPGCHRSTRAATLAAVLGATASSAGRGGRRVSNREGHL